MMFENISVLEALVAPVIVVTTWIVSRITKNSASIENIEKTLNSHLAECSEKSRDVFSILNEVRGDLREIKGEIKHASCFGDPPNDK